MGFWKLLAAVAAFFTVMSLSAAVSAVDMDLVYEAGGYSESDIELMEKITDMISSRSTATLDIEKYDLSYSELEDLYGTVVFNHPEFFYVSMVSADLDYKTKDKILAFTPIYTYSAISSNKMKKQIERAADEILSGIDSSMTVPEKVLYIHDAIVSTCDYYEGKASNKGRTVWSTLIEKSSVCVGYSL
ncbi:MAG: hypothetical protein IKR73_03665, partial [Oscillospiraceae bacterium]|nr:hypothetical protein [Oscillospiraceae bacterium]